MEREARRYAPDFETPNFTTIPYRNYYIDNGRVDYVRYTIDYDIRTQIENVRKEIRNNMMSGGRRPTIEKQMNVCYFILRLLTMSNAPIPSSNIVSMLIDTPNMRRKAIKLANVLTIKH